MVNFRKKCGGTVYGPIVSPQGPVTTTGATIVPSGPVVTTTMTAGPVISTSSAPFAFSGSGAGTAPAVAAAGAPAASPAPAIPAPVPSGPSGPTMPGIAPPSHLSPFNVSAISLPPVSNIHDGTGSHQRTKLIVDPSSVPGSGKLRFQSANLRVTTMLFQLGADVVPNWFGVAVPPGIQDYTKPNIFFHPSPGQAGYKDADYPSKTGKWPQLFFYMERIGYQLDAAIRLFSAPANQIVVMPFLTTAASNTGIFPPNWFGILTDILTDVRSAMGVVGTGPVQISEVVLSSFSVGLVYSNSFRQMGLELKPFLREVWDYDGHPKGFDDSFTGTADFRLRKYDQGNETASIHLPISRWADYPNPPPNPGDRAFPKTGNDVHQLIADHLFLHSATLRGQP